MKRAGKLEAPNASIAAALANGSLGAGSCLAGFDNSYRHSSRWAAIGKVRIAIR